MIFIKMTVGILKNNPNTVNFEKISQKEKISFVCYITKQVLIR